MIASKDRAAITESLEIAAERGGDLTGAVYARLFSKRPELEALFVMDTNGAVRGEMLARVFDAVLDFIGERRYAQHLIGAEATNHDGYNVPRAAFADFFTIVADIVRESCGDAWTQAMAEAWPRLLAELDRYIAAPGG